MIIITVYSAGCVGFIKSGSPWGFPLRAALAPSGNVQRKNFEGTEVELRAHASIDRLQDTFPQKVISVLLIVLFSVLDPLFVFVRTVPRHCPAEILLFTLMHIVFFFFLTTPAQKIGNRAGVQAFLWQQLVFLLFIVCWLFFFGCGSLVGWQCWTVGEYQAQPGSDRLCLVYFLLQDSQSALQVLLLLLAVDQLKQVRLADLRLLCREWGVRWGKTQYAAIVKKTKHPPQKKHYG